MPSGHNGEEATSVHKQAHGPCGSGTAMGCTRPDAVPTPTRLAFHFLHNLTPPLHNLLPTPPELGEKIQNLAKYDEADPDWKTKARVSLESIEKDLKTARDEFDRDVSDRVDKAKRSLAEDNEEGKGHLQDFVDWSKVGHGCDVDIQRTNLLLLLLLILQSKCDQLVQLVCSALWGRGAVQPHQCRHP